jgi:OPA family glycerol-3-phosphate transporter-like MFS transporter 1/2
MIAGSLVLASAAMLLFGGTFSLLTACLCLFVSGAAQAPIWPACTKVLSAWYPQNKLSSVFGIVSTASYVGALGGTTLAIYIQDRYGWKYVFLPAGLVGLAISVIFYFTIKMPKELNIEISGNLQTVGATSPARTSASEQSNNSFGRLWSIPAVPATATAVFCLKFVRYCMYMWLPLYLIEHLHYPKTEGGLFSTMFDIGGIMGGPLLGVLVDKYVADKPLLGIYYLMLVGTITFVLIAFFASWGVVYCSLLLLVAGAANCGPDSLLTGSVTMMIGEKFGKNNGAGVTSLVNGVGSIGAIIEGPIIGLISQHVGWHGVIGCMVLMSFVGTVATLKAYLTLRVLEKNAEVALTVVEKEEQAPLASSENSEIV